MSATVTRGLSRFLSAIVVMISACDVFSVVSAPWWLKYAYDKGYGELGFLAGTPYGDAHPGGSYVFMLIFIMLCGLLMLGLLFEAFRILRNIRRDMPFCRSNAASLFNAAVYASCLSVVFIFKMFFSPSILTLLCTGIFILFALFMLVLSKLFALAAQIREENELTI